MHELAIMENVLEIVQEVGEENGVTEIYSIRIAAGTLTNIIPDWANHFFHMIAKGTIAENAKLEFEILPAQLKCRKCEGITEFSKEKFVFSCSQCGSAEVELLSGKEFYIKEIEANAN